MRTDNTAIRSLHDIGLAGWFGSVLMAAVATNRAVGDIDDPHVVGRITNGVWRRWRLPNAALIGAHLIGATGLLMANKGRLLTQKGVGASSAAKTAVTVAAVASSAYAGLLGKKISDAGDVALANATTPVDDTPHDITSAVRKQAALQWLIPALTAVLIALGALQGEQQRPLRVVSGALDRLNPTS